MGCSLLGSESFAVVIRRYATLLLAGSVLSCAATPAPVVINIQAVENYHGGLHVTTCAAGTVSNIADGSGNVSVADCPTGSQQVELAVKQGDKTYKIPSNLLSVSRTGDHIAVSIDAHLP
jgi:hypothetical protein